MRRLPVLLAFLILPSTGRGKDKSAADWAWDQIRAGVVADFNQRCGALDPRKDAGWDDNCRRIPAEFLQAKLTDPKQLSEAPRNRVRLLGAQIDGTIDLSGADLLGEVWIDAGRIN